MTDHVFTKSLQENLDILKEILHPERTFDLIYRTMKVGKRDACLLFVDGFVKDDIVQKILELFMDMDEEKITKVNTSHDFLKKCLPYGEVDLTNDIRKSVTMLLSGCTLLLVDGWDRCIQIDCRTYPVRSVSEPLKEKVMRGSRDGFVETLIFNAALIRRRIRDEHLAMELFSIGQSSRSDVVLCYMDDRVDRKLLEDIRKRIEKIHVDSLTMNQESLAECLSETKWYNPFPKYRYSERPDSTAAAILEGNIAVLVDNAPSCMLLPSSICDFFEEADDYYFPPIIGSYMRFTRILITILSVTFTPLYYLLCQNPQWLIKPLRFILITEPVHVPIILQFLMLELAVDGLRLAAVNTPNMLSTPLSIIAGIVMGEFSVKSGWFNSEIMLYMAFVNVANYTQTSFELGYALKFFRILILIFTAAFGVIGFIVGNLLLVYCIAENKTLSKKDFLYPFKPFSVRKTWRRLLRQSIHSNEKNDEC